MFPELENDKDNIVKLTYREHYICHWLLTKIYPSSSMTYAFNMLNVINKCKGIHYSSYAYAKSREDYSKHLSEMMKGQKGRFLGHHHTEETKKKISEAFKGEHHPLFGIGHTEESKIKMSLAKKGKPRCVSEQERQMLSEKMKGNQLTKGHHWWNDGVHNKCAEECPGDGWVKGKLITEKERARLCEFNKTIAKEKFLGRSWWNDGINSKWVKECPGNGWVKGRLKHK